MKNKSFTFLLFSIFLFNNSIISLSIIFLFFILFCFTYGNLNLKSVKLLLILAILTSFILNIYKIDFKASIRILELLIGFSFFPLKFENIIFPVNVFRFIILYLFIFFIGNLLGIDFIQNLILKYYPAEGNSWEILYDGTASYSNSLTDILSQRLASIYYNPNLLGQNLTILIIFFLISQYKNKIKSIDYIFLLIAFIMIIGSGSRTAFVVCLIFMFFYLMQFIEKKIFYSFVIPLIILFLTYIMLNTRLLLIFNKADSVNDSMGIKNDILFDFIKNFRISDIFNYIFGFLSFDIQFDYDIGDILHNLGFVGLFSISLFLFQEFYSTPIKYKYFFCFLLISYGATLIINFKFFMLSIMLLSLIRTFSKNTTKYRNT